MTQIEEITEVLASLSEVWARMDDAARGEVVKALAEKPGEGLTSMQILGFMHRLPGKVERLRG